MLEARETGPFSFPVEEDQTMFDFALGAVTCWICMKTPFIQDLAGDAWGRVKARYPLLDGLASWLHSKLGG